MGNTHANKYRQMPSVELLAYDSDAERLDAFARRHEATSASSLSDLITKVDVVDICLPTDLHLPVAMLAIASGRAVFVEKPMASTVEDCASMIDAAERARVPLMPGQVLRFFPEFALGRKLVQDGTVGRPAAARTRRGGRAPEGAGGWFRDVARSGGVLLDLAVHDFDWLRWTLGEVKQVYARSAQVKPSWSSAFDPPEVGDYALVTLTFKSGCVAHVEATWMDPGGARVTFEVCGSEGMIEYDSRRVGTIRTSTADSSRAEAPLAPDDDPYYLQLRGFLNAISNGAPLPVTGEDGLKAVEIARAALDSARTGRVVGIT